MKPVAFDYTRPATVADAARLLATTPDAKILAGGQTLGPMLNLRLAQPALLIDITRIAELAAVREDGQSVTLGATVTHASIEDGRVVDPTAGFLPCVARGIAYRAVRTRGTIGGSLAHADPAADWLSCLTALEAEVLIAGADGERRTPLSGFMRGAMETELRHDELVIGIRIPKYSRHARFGYHKICRKTGEFAEAIGVAVSDPDRHALRLVASTAVGAPIAIDGRSLGLDGARPPDQAILRQGLQAAGFGGDAYDMMLHVTALRRAMTRMQAA